MRKRNCAWWERVRSQWQRTASDLRKRYLWFSMISMRFSKLFWSHCEHKSGVTLLYVCRNTNQSPRFFYAWLPVTEISNFIADFIKSLLPLRICYEYKMYPSQNWWTQTFCDYKFNWCNNIVTESLAHNMIDDDFLFMLIAQLYRVSLWSPRSKLWRSLCMSMNQLFFWAISFTCTAYSAFTFIYWSCKGSLAILSGRVPPGSSKSNKADMISYFQISAFDHICSNTNTDMLQNTYYQFSFIIDRRPVLVTVYIYLWVFVSYISCWIWYLLRVHESRKFLLICYLTTFINAIYILISPYRMVFSYGIFVCYSLWSFVSLLSV